MKTLLLISALVFAAPEAASERVKVNRGEGGIAVYGWLKDGRCLVIPLPKDADLETVTINVRQVEKYLDQDAAGTLFPADPGPATPRLTPAVPVPAGVGSFFENAAPAAFIPSTPDALDEVNSLRARRGLRPFQRDDGLTQGAFRVAQVRAQQRNAGHTSNDFAIGGVSARAGGAGANGGGFAACCVYENWTYAGAASVRGPDGRVYHQLFVR